MSEEKRQSAEPNLLLSILSNKYVRLALLFIIGMLVAFLLGFIPMWLTSRANATERDRVRNDLRRSQLQNTLASAAIDARRADYEAARQSASKFFTEVSGELNSEKQEVFSQTQKEQIKNIIAPRDEVITLLSRSDPVSADKLVDVYVTYRKATEVQ